MQALPKADEQQVLGEAVLNAGTQLGLSATKVGQIIGRNRTSIVRNGINPQAKEGELAMLLIRIYRSLYALMGGNETNMRHFMQTRNLATRGIPAEQISKVTGLVRLVEYLDAMRGRA